MKKIILYALLVLFILATQTGASTWQKGTLQAPSRVSYFAPPESTLLVASSSKLIADIWTGPEGAYPSYFGIYNGELYFAANDGTTGQELWKYDGQSTSLVVDINSSGDSGPQELFEYNGLLYFSADDGIHGRELWKYDGNTASLAADLMTGSGDSIPGYFTLYQDKLYFVASGAGVGRELWELDGTTLTMVPNEINPTGDSVPQELIVYNNELYFAAADHWSGPDPVHELWKYDGTHETLVADINPGEDGSSPHAFAIYKDKLYFAAIGNYAEGSELWVYDGISASLVEDIWSGSANSSNPGGLTVFNGNLYFTARLAVYDLLWKYNGTDVSAVPWVCPTGAPVYGPAPVQLTVYAGSMYFGAEGCQDSVGRELWKLNTAGQISLVKDVWPGDGSSDPYSLKVYENALYFEANDGVHGTELWSLSGLPPIYPELVAPVDTATPKTLRPTFEWQNVSSATSYTLQISRNAGFTNIVKSVSLTGTSSTPSADLPTKSTLFWRVRAKNENGAGAWSAIRSLLTPNPPGVPVLASPALNFLSTTYTPLFKWSIVSLPTGTQFKSYQIQVDNNSDFSSPEIDDTSVTNRLTPQWISTPLVPNTKFYWRVRSVNEADEFSRWSSVWYFRSAMLPPELVGPTDAQPVPGVRPSFSWETVDGASKYQLVVSQYLNLSSPLLNVTVTGSNYAPAANMPAKKTLYWRVRALGLNGPSLWSEQWSFTTGNPPGIPGLVSPANGSLTQDYTPSFNWNNSTLPVGTTFVEYQIQVDLSPSFSSPWINASTTPGDLSDSDYTAAEVEALAANQTYYWRVRAVNNYNGTDQLGPWSSVWSVRTAIAPPTLLSPANLSTGVSTQPTFTWQTVPGASGYTIQASTVPSFSSLNINSSTANPTFKPSIDLPANQQIYWRVRSNGLDGPGPWSEVWTFNQPTVAIPTIVSPANGASLRVPVVLQWNAATLATKYQVRYVQLGSDIYVTQPEQTELTFTLYQPNNWLWQVRAGDALGNWTDWSTPYSLEALGGAFSAAPEITSPASGSTLDTLRAHIKWTIPFHVGGWMYGSDLYRIQIDNNNDFSSPEYEKAKTVDAYEGSFPDLTGVAILVPNDWHPALESEMIIPPDGTYYVRVQGETADGLTSEWSTPITLHLQLSYSDCSNLIDGPRTYNFSWGPFTENYPKLLSLSLDDLLPEQDQTITFSVNMIVEPYHTEPAPGLDPITSVVLYLSTDHKTSEPIPLTLASGTGVDGIWQGQWTADDSFCYRYEYLFQATNAATTLPFDIFMRDGD